MIIVFIELPPYRETGPETDYAFSEVRFSAHPSLKGLIITKPNEQMRSLILSPTFALLISASTD